MSTGTSKNGNTINVGDHVSLTAKVVSYTGSGSKAAVTAQAPLDSGTISIQANDAKQAVTCLQRKINAGKTHYSGDGCISHQ